jgi:UDP-N-acetyl-D-mannosaminuronic acid transferase (WecB/TagA/CpsF family)
VRAIGMEWVYRLAQEPTRLASRYIVGNALFLARVAKLKWGQAA